MKSHRGARRESGRRLGRGMVQVRPEERGGIMEIVRKNPHVKVIGEWGGPKERPAAKPYVEKELPPGIPYEDDEQAAFVDWARENYPDVKFFSVPNGGKRHPRTAAQLERTGTSPGVPDLVFPIAKGGFHGLFIEMKRRKGGRVMPEQTIWHDFLEAKGYLVEVTRGCEEAKSCLWAYMNLGDFTTGPPPSRLGTRMADLRRAFNQGPEGNRGKVDNSKPLDHGPRPGVGS